jgi:Na+-translocating ferredoxin:NAD+ oxidoreductase RnfC subunit
MFKRLLWAPMMGNTVYNTEVPVIKGTNSVLALTKDDDLMSVTQPAYAADDVFPSVYASSALYYICMSVRVMLSTGEIEYFRLY